MLCCNIPTQQAELARCTTANKAVHIFLEVALAAEKVVVVVAVETVALARAEAAGARDSVVVAREAEDSGVAGSETAVEATEAGPEP